MKNSTRIAIASLVVALAACGAKGPLFLPPKDAPPAKPAVAEPASAAKPAATIVPPAAATVAPSAGAQSSP